MHPDYVEAYIRFIRDTENHKMTIIRAEGVNRHLRFRNPECSAYWFDIVTWPGVLCINGDMGTYVFSRLNDMFEFFSVMPERYPINPGYWAEKIIARDKHDSIDEFDVEKFRRVIADVWASRMDDVEERERLDDELLLSVDDSMTREEAFILAAEYEVNGVYPFRDIWEYTCKKYTFHYLWNCFAIPYAIKTFKESTV